MATLKQLKTNFVSGELDPLMVARPDIKHYHNAAKRMRNVVSIPQGGFTTRPGSRFLHRLPYSEVRLASFQYTTDEAYLFAFTHNKLTIFYAGSVVAELVTPYTDAHLVSSFKPNGEMNVCGINWTQSLDQMIVYHESVIPHVIKRGGSHTAWTIEAASFDNMPLVDFGAVYTNGVNEVQNAFFPEPWRNGDTFVITLEDEQTSNILMSDGISAGDMALRIQNALNDLPNVDGGIIVTANGPGDVPRPHTYTITFAGRSGQRPWGDMNYRILSSEQSPTISFYMITRGQRPGEPAISDLRGWPRCGVFFQGRHWMAGSKSLPNTLWATRSGTDWDLNDKRDTDDYGFMYSADTDDVPAFLNIYPGRHLQLFSTAGEFYIPVSEREGVTPRNMVLRRTSSRGSKPGLRVCEVDGATAFIQAGGKALREFIYADTEAAYQSNSISLLSSHLMRDPLALSMRRATSTDSADLMFMPNGDGSMTVFCTLRTQEVNAMALWETAGNYRDACPVYNDVYIAVDRTIDGVRGIYIEQLDDEISVDCGVVAGAISGVWLDWLPNTTIDVVLDGAVQQQIDLDGTGSGALERPSTTSAVLGLPWPEVAPDEFPGYRWLVETLPVDAELQDGTMFGRKRRIVWTAFRMHETTGLIVNGSRVAMRRYGGNLLDRPNPRTSGTQVMKGLLGWDYEGKMNFGETEPTQATVLALSWAVSI